jgi:hypothetical protein
MAVPTTTELKTRFDIAAQISNERIDFAIEDALSSVEDAIGIDVYNEIFSAATSTVEDSSDDTDSTTANEETRRTRKVTNAVYFRAIANCLENANTRIRASGSVKKEQDMGSPGMGSGAQVTNEYLSVEEVGEMVGRYNSKADSLLQPYLLDESINSFVEFELCR